MDTPAPRMAFEGSARDRWILSLDGGGMRGLTTAVFLARLEAEIGRPLHECFDMIAGTSSGAIVAGGVSCGPDGKQIVPTSELVELFSKDGRRIFRRSAVGVFHTLRWLRGPLYSTRVLQDAIGSRVGSLNLSQVTTDLLVTAYDMREGQPVLFQSWLSGPEDNGVAARDRGEGIVEMCPTAKGSPTPDFGLRDVLVASSAVPTFFAPVQSAVARGEHGILIDGFVFALNPVLPAYFAARRRYGVADRLHILSIGTGRHAREYSYEDLRKRGAVGWLRPVLEAFPGGASAASETYMDWITEIANVEHVRINPLFDHVNDPSAPSPQFDDASRKNIARLKAAGETLFEQSLPTLEPTLAKLKAHAAVS